MSTCTAQGNIVSTTKAVKHLNARRRATCSIFFPWAELHSRVLFLCPLTEETLESSFQNSLRNFFRRLESYIAEAASWPERR